jgi:ribosomal protein L40E
MTEAEERDQRARSDDMERTLARTLAWALPATTVVAAIGVGFLFGVGPGILTLAAGALVSVIGLLWASLRTLAGDAPLADGLAAAAVLREGGVASAEKKRRVLRALKDLELEHAVGKMDDADYAEISRGYREEAKAILREADIEIEPLRTKAEALAIAHLKKVGLRGDDPAPASSEVHEGATTPSPVPSSRRGCAACGAPNDADAVFCKKCGARVARVDCGGCGTSNDPDATFCKRCGTTLGPKESEAKNAAR